MTTNAIWYLYLLRCADNSLYCGVTTDLARRVEQHNIDNKRGAKYTRVRRPVSLAYAEQCLSRSDACQKEYQVKQLSKAKKEQLVASYLSAKS